MNWRNSEKESEEDEEKSFDFLVEWFEWESEEGVMGL